MITESGLKQGEKSMLLSDPTEGRVVANGLVWTCLSEYEGMEATEGGIVGMRGMRNARRVVR